MTLPLSGVLGFGDINEELDVSVAEQLGLGEALARSLASTSANPPASEDEGSVIGVGNFYGAVNGLIAGYLIVGGGGGGLNGGGGGGGVVSGVAVLAPEISYPVKVGIGGPGGSNNGANSSIGFGGPAPIPPLTVSYLVVGGGGGGNGGVRTFLSQNALVGPETIFAGAGGGGGGVLNGTLTMISGSTYSVIVGAGGGIGQNGDNSSFSDIVAIGGGAGNEPGSPGGSGGGGLNGPKAVGSPGGQGFPGQGFSGSPGSAGGGGGAGQAGVGINGGNGKLVSISGVTAYYGGGGGGGGRSSFFPNSGSRGVGGAGGGASFGGAGAPGTGGGGGGAEGSGLNGGSGIVIVSYQSAVPLLEGGQISVNVIEGLAYQVHTFTTTGTLRFVEPPSLNLITAIGGGAGGGGDATGPGLSGGSGGGGGAGSTSAPPSTGPGGSATSGQGFAGGTGFYAGVNFAMGGGGGASAAGQNGQTSDSNGGAGVSSSITGTAVTYGGGGGGYRRGTFADLSKGLGGAGGGGNGAVENPVGTLLRDGVAGTNGLGGGGGAGSNQISMLADNRLYARSDGRWGGFQNTYAVWPTTGSEVAAYTIYRYFTAPYTGTYYFRSTVDNSGSIYIDDSLIGGTANFNQNPSPVARTVTAGSHLLRFDVYNAGDVAGIAVTVSNSSDQVIWDTRTYASVLPSSGSSGGSGVAIVSYVALVPQLTGGTITSYVNGSSKTVQVHTFTSNGVLGYPTPSISWAVPAGSLETVPQGANVTTVSLGATSSLGNPVTYTLNGSLPSGLSFNSGTGVISGKTNNNVTRTVWNFSVTVTDSVKSQLTSTREFSYTISNPVYTTALITKAGYQGGCTSVDNRVTQLQSVCNGQFTCTFTPLSYGDPFVGTVKQFVVTMSCTNGTGVYSNTCLGADLGPYSSYASWTFSCTAL